MKKDIQDILKKADNLQYNFHIAVKVSKMLEDVNVSTNELSTVIGADQALTAKLLKHCNSAEYGFSRKITTVREAITRIGFKSLKTILFTIVSKSPFNQEIKGYGLEKGEIWKNAVSCAVYCRYIAELTGYYDPDQAFTAGLLRDIGKLILHEYVKDKYEQIIKMVSNENISFSLAEEKVLGYNHSQVGVHLADKWRFPKLLVDTIKYHHDPKLAEQENCEDVLLIKIVHFADYLSVMMGYGIGKDGMMYEIDMNALEALGVDLEVESMELLISDIVNLNTEIESLVSGP